MLADAFPRLEARIEGDEVARARLRFRAEGEERWYSVLMFGREGAYSAVLPKPNASATAIRYALEATNRNLGEASTEEFTARVVEAADACGAGRLAGIAVSPPQVAVTVPEGTRSLPGGFSSKNVVGAYASGKPVKGHPRTAFFAVAGAGALAGGLSLLKDEPTSSAPILSSAYVRLAGSTPGPGATISLSRGSLFMSFDVYLPRSLPAGGQVRLVMHEGLVTSSRGCVTLIGSYGAELPSFTPRQVSVGTPFAAVDPGCGSSFGVTRARVTFEAFGEPYVATDAIGFFGEGTGMLDVHVDYRFEP